MNTRAGVFYCRYLRVSRYLFINQTRPLNWTDSQAANFTRRILEAAVQEVLSRSTFIPLLFRDTRDRVWKPEYIAVSKEEATHTFQTSCGLNIAMTMFFACISHLCPLSSSLSRFISRATVDRKLSFKHNDNGPSLFNCLLLLSISYEDTSADDRAIFHKRFYDLLLWIWNTYIFFKMYIFIARAM